MTIALAAAGFTILRNLLEGRVEGGTAAALKLSEALHNMPSDENPFTGSMVLLQLKAFVLKYPQFNLELAPHITELELRLVKQNS